MSEGLSDMPFTGEFHKGAGLPRNRLSVTKLGYQDLELATSEKVF